MVTSNQQALHRLLHFSPPGFSCRASLLSQVRMDRDLLRSGDRACVRFRFLIRPEYVRAVRCGLAITD